MEQKSEQKKYIVSIRRDRKLVKKGGNSRLGANQSVNAVDNNISSTIHWASKRQGTIIRARKIPCPIAGVHALVDEVIHTRV